MLSLARDGEAEAETIRVDQRAEPGNKWAHSGVVEYKVRHRANPSLSSNHCINIRCSVAERRTLMMCSLSPAQSQPWESRQSENSVE